LQLQALRQELRRRLRRIRVCSWSASAARLKRTASRRRV